MVDGQVYQFGAPCLGLSTASQVFTRVMAPALKILHGMGVRLLHYLDDWLILASSHQEALWARDLVLDLCLPLGIVVNPMKVLFLLSLATAKRVGKLQALSRHVVFRSPDMSLSYLPEFVAKTESLRNPLPWSFLVKSLEDFVGDMPEERSLCPVRAIRIYLGRTLSLSPRPCSLFVSPSNPSLSLPKNALPFFLRWVILDSGSVVDSSTPRAHSFRGVGTSVTFMRNWSASRVLEAATWRSNSVFTFFFFLFVFFKT